MVFQQCGWNTEKLNSGSDDVKMLDNKVIIYDDSCPMCKLYTYWFVAWGFLRPENRIGFATAPEEVTSRVDLVRGRHEIPLFDRKTKETIYGLNALTFVLASRWEWLRPFFGSQVFMWMFYPLYQVITYNRRVIAGCKTCSGFDCAPDLNRFYRTLYLLIASVTIGVIGFLLQPESGFADPSAIAPASASVWVMSAFAIVGLVLASIRRLTTGSLATWNFAGNYLTSLLIVALMLIPLVVVPAMPTSMAWVNLMAASLMGLEENRRRSINLA